MAFSEKQVLDLSAFHVRFSITQTDSGTPNSAEIKLYNLSRDLVNTLTENCEYKAISIAAGYENDNFGTIFQGDIVQYRIGRESATDTYLDILAGDYSFGYQNNFINTSIAKGTSLKTQLDTLTKATGLPLKTDERVATTITEKPALSRGKILFGFGRLPLRHLAGSLDATWSVQNGVLELISTKGYMADEEAVVLSPSTGMIGIPEQTVEGVTVKCLLNSRLRIGRLMQIDSGNINKTQYADRTKLGPAYNAFDIDLQAPLNIKDGLYRMLVIEHEGDTRGGPWYSNVVGLYFDATNKQTLAPA